MKMIFVNEDGVSEIRDDSIKSVISYFDMAEICFSKIKPLETVKFESCKYSLIYEDGDLTFLDKNPLAFLLTNKRIFGSFYIVKVDSEGNYVDFSDLDTAWIFNILQWSNLAVNSYKEDN